MNFGMIILGGDKIFFTFLCLGTPPPWNGFRTRKVKSMCLLVRFNQRALKPPFIPKAGGPLPPFGQRTKFSISIFSRLPRRTYIGKKEFTEKMCLVQKIAKQVMAESFVSGGLLASRKSIGKGQRK